MKILVLAPEKVIPPLQRTFENRGYVGVEFMYLSDIDSVFEDIDLHGFYMSKLVILTALLQDYDDQQRQDFVEKIVSICNSLEEEKEIYLFDSSQLIATEYASQLSFYSQVVYQDQKVHMSEVLNIVMGDYVTQDADNIDQSIKPRNFIEKLKSKKNANKGIDMSQEQTQSQDEQKASNGEGNEDDLLNLTEDESNTQDIQDQDQEPSENLEDFDDTPLFTDEDEDESTDTEQSQGEQLSSSEEEQQKPKQTRGLGFPMKRNQKKEPIETTEPETNKPSKKARTPVSYLEVFQRRTKIILCTGERRSGVSTFVSNIAQQMQRDGLACLIVDLDFERRGQAINFPFEHDRDDVRLIYSLYNAVKSLSGIQEHAIALDDGLDFLGTSLYVEDTDKMYEHVTNDNLQRLLTVALSEYDIILIDCPFALMKIYPCLVAMSNLIVHSTCTDIRSIYNTLNSLTESDFSTTTDYNLYISKMMLLLNCYTKHTWKGKEIDEKLITRVMSELTDSQVYMNFGVLGHIPFLLDYDTYMSNGKMLIDKPEYRDIFVELLNNLALKG